MAALPYRSPPQGPAERPRVPLPPGPMPLLRDGRPLKRWRWVGVFGEELMACFGAVSIGGLPQCFWALWDRRRRVLREATHFRAGPVRVEPGRVRVRDRGVRVDLLLAEDDGMAVETVSPHGASYAWTRKRAGVRAAGSVVVDGRARGVGGRAVIDESAGYHARETAWSWSAGVGEAVDGRPVAWNLVEGVHDSPRLSERTVWVGGGCAEAGPVRFDADLQRIEAADGSWGLRAVHEALRERDDRIGPLLRSRYRQPFAGFSGTLPGGVELGAALGVTERHDVRW